MWNAMVSRNRKEQNMAADVVPDEQLVSAKGLKVLPPGTAWKMAKAGKIPFYQVGVGGRGIRFRVSEVLEALRRPVR
jgi:hypothetical protein